MSEFEVIENEKGYIVYKNLQTNEINNDNPWLNAKIGEIKIQYIGINYVTYRCGLKLFALKKELYTLNIPYNFVTSIFHRHGYVQSDDSPLIKPVQLTSLIHDIFYAAEKMGYYAEQPEFELDHTCAMLANLFWNLFDPKRATQLSLLEVKLTFLLLCDSQSFEQLVKEHNILTADHNFCVSRCRFESMLHILAKLCACLDDNEQFEVTQTNQIVYECFEEIPGLVGLNEYQFANIWRSGVSAAAPKSENFTIYANILRLVRRLKDSQENVHRIACAGCQTSPIKGMYFKCQKCRNCCLCLKCFSYGFNNRKHNVNHRMYEISSVFVKPKRFATFITKLCTIFNRSTPSAGVGNKLATHNTNDFEETKIVERNCNIEVLPPIDASRQRETNGDGAGRRNSTVRLRGNKSIYSTIAGNSTLCQSFQLMEKISLVIDILNEENEMFKQRVADEFTDLNEQNNGFHEYLQAHRATVEEQIGKLKEIYRKNLTSALPYSSTPYRHGNTKRRQMLDIDIGPTSPTISKSIHGSDVNKSYLEANKSDFSLADISSWLQTRQSYYARNEGGDFNGAASQLSDEQQTSVDGKMMYFKQLLTKVKEIIDDSYSDNSQLAKTTQQLELVLDRIIGEEEKRRSDDFTTR